MSAMSMYPDFSHWYSAGEARPRFRLRFRRSWLLVALAVVVLIAGLVAWVGWQLPLDRAMAPLSTPTIVLLDRNGTAFARHGAYREAPVDVRLLPAHVVGAVLAIEDRRFYSHAAIDPRGILRALVYNARAGAVVQGGSTISQQLAKTAFLTPERTLHRKLQEILLAGMLESRLSKQEILSRYLSSVYFGDGVYGLRAAARHYFDVAPEQLDLAQAAMLAGMIKAPSALAPTHDLAAAQARARLVLRAMVETGAITAAQAQATRPATVTGARAELPFGGYFADWVLAQPKDALAGRYGELTVRTTMDARLQRLAESVLREHLDADGAPLHATQAALIAMHPDGAVVAMVGGRDYAASAFNRATKAKRQPGSAFKLFVYRAALQAGATPESTVVDAPVSVGNWSPENFGGEYRGRITLREAFAHSINSAAVRIEQQVGAPAVIRSARELGITTPLGSDASLALGSYETTLIELTAAYAAEGAGVAPVTPYGIDGAAPNAARTRLDPVEQRMMLDLLWSVVEEGTGRAARLDVPVFGRAGTRRVVPTFGKTGTTQDNRDALFIGMAGDLVTGVWVGNDDDTPMRGVVGGGLPATIWHDFMTEALGVKGSDASSNPYPFDAAVDAANPTDGGNQQSRHHHEQRHGWRGWWRRLFH